ncbi:HmuY protein [Fontimonas thermophila]|uniref:HmuY protein n=1 Tax=Fontimonas thermophila TaxID=1076937 RepID=A0A1I2I9R2_9GAMM|nr:HmuY family protein [Fontimonas thermophila]SFF39079.1 HmuY protein [Fontimonas thermophila]
MSTLTTGRWRACCASAALALAACAGDISPNPDADDPGTQPGTELPGPGGTQAVFTQHADGHYQAAVDASGDDWVYIDLDTQTQVFPPDPAASDAWDLAHRGVDIKLNGGVSGAPPGGIDAAVYAHKVAAGESYPFASIDAAPPPGEVEYVTDAEGSVGGNPSDPLDTTAYAMSTHPQADADPDPLTGAGDYGWYRYSGYLAGSAISARANVGYVLRTVECRYYKLRMTGYYDATGASAHPQYDFLEIDGSPCSDVGGAVAPLGRAVFTPTAGGMRADVDAADENAWVYLDLSHAQQVAPNAPARDAAGWDLAIRRTDIKLNGGSSGAGIVAIHDLLRDDWSARTAVPADAQWHSDADGALAFVTYPPRERGGECAFGADGDYGWYYYSGFCDKGNGMHHISPRDVVYVVRGRDGHYWKLRMLDYYGDAGESGHPSFEFAALPPP